MDLVREIDQNIDIWIALRIWFYFVQKGNEINLMHNNSRNCFLHFIIGTEKKTFAANGCDLPLTFILFLFYLIYMLNFMFENNRLYRHKQTNWHSVCGRRRWVSIARPSLHKTKLKLFESHKSSSKLIWRVARTNYA